MMQGLRRICDNRMTFPQTTCEQRAMPGLLLAAALGPARKIAADSNKVEDHIWLGQLLSVVSRRMRRQERTEEADSLLTEAEEALRHAVILKVDAPEPWVALIQFFAQTQQTAKAEETIMDARRRLPPALAATALGQCYEVLNQPEKATEHYEIAIQNAPKDPLLAQSAATFYHRVNQIAKARADVRYKGLCGDCWLESEPEAAGVIDVFIKPSVRDQKLRLQCELRGLDPLTQYRLSAAVLDGDEVAKEFSTGWLDGAEELAIGIDVGDLERHVSDVVAPGDDPPDLP